MQENNPEKRAIRTVRRKKLQDLLAVLSFLLLLPYSCAVFSGGRRDAAVETFGGMSDSKEYILWEKENGICKMPLEEFLVGALAASIPAGYREETLKAQAVILRSICMQEMQEADLLQKDTGPKCLEQAARQALWGEDFAENEARFVKAVQDTQGIVLTWQNEIVKPPYFRLSAGKTRSGGEIFGEEKATVAGGGAKNWCHSVECVHDLEAEEFLQEKRMDKKEFYKKLSEEGFFLPESRAKVTLTRDSAGYVLFLACGECRMEGEKFRKLFELPSSSFSLREEAGKIILQTKGVGHGLGFDQYGADLLAEGGKDYAELLDFFFTGLTLEKRSIFAE